MCGCAEYSGGQEVTEADKKKQAATLAEIAALPKDATIADFNRQRFSANVIIPDLKQKLN
jgi:hypothetical protein